LTLYKDHKVYQCFALNRLVAELDIDLYQDGLEGKLDIILAEKNKGVSKEAIKHEIRSNHFMTNKVLESLEQEGLIRIKKDENRYRVLITREGILHIRRYNEFYKKLYEQEIKDHYRFVGLPYWFR